MGANARLELHKSPTFYAEGMSPDNSKVQAVQEWSRTRDATDIYKTVHWPRIILLEIYSALHIHCKIPPQVDAKRYHIPLGEECEQSIRNLKTKLTEAPILAYPRFDKEASPMVFQPYRIRYIEQDGQVIVSTSETLSMS